MAEERTVPTVPQEDRTVPSARVTATGPENVETSNLDELAETHLSPEMHAAIQENELSTQSGTHVEAQVTYMRLVDQLLRQIDEQIAMMRRDQAEINELKAETRAMLRKLRAA